MTLRCSVKLKAVRISVATRELGGDLQLAIKLLKPVFKGNMTGYNRFITITG